MNIIINLFKRVHDNNVLPLCTSVRITYSYMDIPVYIILNVIELDST